jgi:hypothetical protein
VPTEVTVPVPPVTDVNDILALPFVPDVIVTVTVAEFMKFNPLAETVEPVFTDTGKLLSVPDPPPPPVAVEVNAMRALPSPGSVTETNTVAVFTKFNCLFERVEPPLAETRAVFAAAAMKEVSTATPTLTQDDPSHLQDNVPEVNICPTVGELGKLNAI